MTFARIDLDGTVLQVAKGDLSWPSIAEGEWIEFPWRKARYDKKYDRTSGEWIDV